MESSFFFQKNTFRIIDSCKWKSLIIYELKC